MTNFKKLSIKKAASYVMNELNCTLLDAISKMQTTCVRNGNNEMLEELCEFKLDLIEELNLI